MSKLFKQLRLILTLKCDQAARLTSEGLDRRLAWYEGWALRAHRLVCWSCRQFERQMRFMRSAMLTLQEQEERAKVAPPAPHAFKERLKAMQVKDDD